MSGSWGSPSSRHIHLTARERQVLRCRAYGWTAKKTGRLLGISPRTVQGYLGRVYAKLGIPGDGSVHRPTAAVLQAMRDHLI